MQKLFLILFYTSAMFMADIAQSQTLYGLKKIVNGSSTIAFDVVNIDPMTGSTSIVLSTNSLIAVAAGASTYDQQNSRYICWGYDTENSQRLYTMDLANLITTNIAFNSIQPIEMEYDLQTQKTFGLWWDGTAEHFGEIDLLTGEITSISILPGVDAVAIGNSTFDSNTGTYIFIGVDGNDYKLYSVNASTGTIVNSPTVLQDGNRFSALEFNNQSGGKLYGLYQDTDYENYSQVYQSYYTNLRLVEIDLISGTSTLVDDQSSVIGGYLTGYSIGGLCFDQETQTYIVWVQNETGAYLKLVDVLTGNIIASTALDSNENFYELQVDNYYFANNFYNLLASNDNPVNTTDFLADVSIYPNPAIDHLTIESEEKIESYIIYSLNGVVVKQSSDFIDNKLQIGNLTSGCYFFAARTLRGNILKKFIVR